ncbi:multiubiquitin domain-containing protein [Mesorhizobium sp. f-mel]
MANPNADTVEIFVNTQPYHVPKGEISHADLVKIAYGIVGEEVRGYSVTYERGSNSDKPDDVLPFGGSVKGKKEMRFDVFPTGRS